MGSLEQLPCIPMHEYEINADDRVPEKLWQMWHRLYKIVIFFKTKDALILQNFCHIWIASPPTKKVRILLNGVSEEKIAITFSEESGEKPWSIESTDGNEFEKIRLIFV